MNVTSSLAKIAAAVVGAGALAIASTGVATAAPAAATQATEIVYEVMIEGTASGNPFSRTATLTLMPTVTDVTTNGINPFEACLRSGFPAGTPRPGRSGTAPTPRASPTTGRPSTSRTPSRTPTASTPPRTPTCRH